MEIYKAGYSLLKPYLSPTKAVSKPYDKNNVGP